MTDALPPGCLINLTEHEVVVLDVDKNVVETYEPHGTAVRLDEEAWPLYDQPTKVPFSGMRYTGGVRGIPAPQSGVGYIVSRLAAQSVARKDLFFPYPEIRDDKGRIIGCGGFAQFLPNEPPPSHS